MYCSTHKHVHVQKISRPRLFIYKGICFNRLCCLLLLLFIFHFEEYNTITSIHTYVTCTFVLLIVCSSALRVIGLFVVVIAFVLFAYFPSHSNDSLLCC